MNHTKRRITVHPLFLSVMVVGVFVGYFSMSICCLIAVLLHELGHITAGRMCGYAMKRLTLMPYGAMLSSSESIPPKALLPIALSGPLTNLTISLFLTGIWWLEPKFYEFTLDFFVINTAIGLFNLLPAFPLDGSRIALCISSNRKSTIKALRIVGVVVAVMLLGLFVYSLFNKMNVFLGVMGLALLIGALDDGSGGGYASLLSANPYVKKYKSGVTCLTVKVSTESTLMQMMRMTDSSKQVSFEVVDNDGDLIARYSEEDLLELLSSNASNIQIGSISRKYATN